MEVKSVLLLISIAIFQIFCYSYFSDDSRWLRDDSISIAVGQSRIASKDDIRKIRSLNTDSETNRLTISLTDENPNKSGFHTNGTSEPGFTTNISSSTIVFHENASDVNLPDSKFSDNSTLKKIEETSTEESILQQSSESFTENIISTSPTSYPLEISSLTIVDGKEIDNNKTMEQNDIGQTPSITTDAVNANFSFSLDVETTTTKNSKSNIDSQLNNTDYNINNPNMEPSAFGSESARIPNVTETSTKVSITTLKFELESDKVQVPTSLDTMSNQTTISSDTEPISNSVTENSTTTVQSISRSITEKNTTMTDSWQTVDPITSEVPENTTTAQPNSMTGLNETESYNQTTAQPITNPVTEQPSTQSYNGTTVDPSTNSVTENTSTQSYIQSTVDPITSTATEITSTQSYNETTVDPITSNVTEITSTHSFNETTVDPITSNVTEITSTQSYNETTVDPITSTVTENATMTVHSTTNSVTEQSSTQTTSVSIQPLTTTTIRPSTSQSITETSVTDFTTKESVSTTNRITTPFTHLTYPTENETASHIDQECDCHGDDLLLPQCKEICALSINLSGFHINLAFFGLKIRMILSNRDYLICIGVFLGITLVLVGFVARMIQRRKRRRMIAQRNFEILYQDFGVQSEKTKKWLADFNYQSSIL